MRFVFAISALVLSGILLLLAIGNATFLAGPRVITYTAELTGNETLFVMSADQLAEVPGQANVVVSGVDPVVAFGNTRDVEAWAAPFAHHIIETDSNNRSFFFEPVTPNSEAAAAYTAATAPVTEPATDQAADIEIPSPAQSDLWLGEQSSEVATERQASPGEATDEQTVRLPVKLAEDQSVIVSVANPGSAQLSVDWVQNRSMPLVGPLLLAGGFFAVLGLLLYLLAVDHDRRGLGPRRGRKGLFLGIRDEFAKRKKSKAVACIALGASGVLVMSGCSPNYWPSAVDSQSVEEEATNTPQNLAPVPLTQAQIERILADVSQLAGDADESLDASSLPSRFTADALVERETNYKIRKNVSDYDVVMPGISDTLLDYQLVQSTETWPRTMLVVVDSVHNNTEAEGGEKEDAPSIALILTQENPHANYLVSRAIVLRGNIQMPEAAPAEEGTAVLADDLQTLVLPPNKVGQSYAAILTGGAAAPESEDFNLEGDTLVSRSGASWVTQAAAAAASAGQDIQYSVSARQADTKITSLSTGVGGALVATTVLETRTEQAAPGSTWRPTVTGSVAALSGLSGRQDKIVSVVAHQLLFYVPSLESGEKIQLLGFSSDLVSASNG